MGRIVISDGVQRRTIPVEGVFGDIEIDLAGEEHTVVVPPGVGVERRETRDG